MPMLFFPGGGRTLPRMSNPGMYDTHRARFAFYQDAYWGGEYWRNPSSPTIGTAKLYNYVHNRETDVITEILAAQIRSYLVPYPGEKATAFQARHSIASYINFVAPIIDAYADAATGHVVRDLGNLSGYLKNLNGRGRTWDQHMGEVARWTAVYGFTATLYDFPAANPAANRAEEEALGIGLRAILIHPSAIAWIDVDDDGRVTEFAYVDQPYVSDLTANSMQKVNLWRFTLNGWEKRTSTVDLARGFLEQRNTFMQGELTGHGPLPIAGEIPVRFSFFREVTSSRWPLGISLVADAADIAREVYNTLSNIGDIHRKTAFPFLAIPTKAAAAGLEPETKIQVGPDQGIGFSSETGAPTWVQPSAEQTQELRNHSIFLVGAAYRMSGLEVSTEGTSDVQSGLAIQLKSRGFEGRCGRFASNLNEFEHSSLDLAARMLAQTPGYTVTYPKRYVLPDAAEDLARAILIIQTLDGKLGAKGETAAVRQALDAALSLSDEELEQAVGEVQAKLAAAAGPQGAMGAIQAAGGGGGGSPMAQATGGPPGGAAPTTPNGGSALANLTHQAG